MQPVSGDLPSTGLFPWTSRLLDERSFSDPVSVPHCIMLTLLSTMGHIKQYSEPSICLSVQFARWLHDMSAYISGVILLCRAIPCLLITGLILDSLAVYTTAQAVRNVDYKFLCCVYLTKAPALRTTDGVRWTC